VRFLQIILGLQILALILICAFHGGVSIAGRCTGDFDEGTAGWKVIDGSISSVVRETEPAHIYQGKGSLRFDYEWKPGKIPACGTQKAGLEGKKAVRFWIKSKEATAIAVVIRERSRGNYLYPVALGQPGLWKEVAFNFCDMKSEKECSRQGPDTRGASLGIVDFLTVAAKKEGKKTVWIDSVELYDHELPGPALSAGRSADTGQWLPLSPGLSSINILPRSPGMKEPMETIEFEYTLEPGTIVAMARMGFDLQGFSAISFQVKTSEPSEMVLVVEEKNRARYIHTFPTGENRWQRVRVTPDQFTLAPDSADDNTMIDRERLNGILCLADMDNFLCLKTGTQKLWLTDFRIEQDGGCP